MLVFSRNSQYGTRRETATQPLNNNDKVAVVETAVNSSGGGSGTTPTTSISSFFSRATDRQRTGRSSMKKSRPHSWHSTIQKGLARARSRSLGRDREKERAKRASSALTTGKIWVILPEKEVLSNLIETRVITKFSKAFAYAKFRVCRQNLQNIYEIS
jgi:hypothetical protein